MKTESFKYKDFGFFGASQAPGSSAEVTVSFSQESFPEDGAKVALKDLKRAIKQVEKWNAKKPTTRKAKGK